MIRKTLTIALLTVVAVGFNLASPSPADAQTPSYTGKTTKKRTVKKRTTTRTTKRTTRHRSHRHRSGVNVRVHVGTHGHHYRHYRGHHVHHYPHYDYYRHTTVIRPQREIVVIEPSFALPRLDCPIRTDEARLGLEQWCETPMGNRHGLYRRWYDDGTLAAEGEYKYDLREGVWVEFHPNGAVRSEGEYDDGEKVGLWTTWGADGEQLVAVEY